MRLKTTTFGDYNPEMGVVNDKGTPVWQLLVEDGSPWYDLMKPLDEVVIEARKKSLTEIASDMDLSEVSQLSIKKSKVVKEEETEENDFDVEELNSKEKELPVLNQSVIGVGVSLNFFKEHSDWLSDLKRPVFVYVKLFGETLAEASNFINENIPALAKMYFVLDTELSFKDLIQLSDNLTEEGYKNIRFVGENVPKLNIGDKFGLFSKQFIQRFSLELNYLGVVHSMTQVRLLQKNVAAQPIEELDYKKYLGNLKVAKPKTKKSKQGECGSSKEKKPKKKATSKSPSKKKKMSAFELLKMRQNNSTNEGG